MAKKPTQAKAQAGEESQEAEAQKVQRRRINRGSVRRMGRALERFQKDMADFIEEMDLQVYAADEKGERVGPWPLIAELREMKLGVTAHVTAVMNGELEREPEPEPEIDE